MLSDFASLAKYPEVKRAGWRMESYTQKGNAINMLHSRILNKMNDHECVRDVNVNIALQRIKSTQ